MTPTRSDALPYGFPPELFQFLPSEELLRQELCRRVLRPRPSGGAIKEAQWFLELRQRYDRGEFA